MMQATEFEFRNRWWLFGMISGTSFSLLAFDHVPAGGRIAGRLMPAMQLSETNSPTSAVTSCMIVTFIAKPCTPMVPTATSAIHST